jgi:hypothetical protein
LLATCLALDELYSVATFAPGQLDDVASQYPPRLLRLLGAMRIRRGVRERRHDKAVALAHEHRLLGSDATGDEQQIHGELLLASLEVKAVGGGSASVARAVQRELKRALKQGLRSGDGALALRHLHMAILLAAPGRLLHPFLQQRDTWRPLMESLRDRDLGLTQANELWLVTQFREACAVRSSHSTP